MRTDSRRLDAAREGRSELENHYIDELVAGRLGRREFLRRGAALGMSAGVMGAVLAACGGANKTGGSGDQLDRVRRQHDRRDQGRDDAARQPGAVGRGQPADGLRRRRALHARADRRVPHPRQQPGAPAAADARDQLEGEQRRQGVDVQAPARASSSTTAARSPPTTSCARFSSWPTRRTPPTRCRRSVACSLPRACGRSTATPSNSTSRRRTATSPTSSPPTTTTRSSCPRAPTSGQVAEDVRRHRSVQARQLHAEPGRDVHRQPGLLGRQAEPRHRPVQLLRQPGAADHGALRAATST